MDDTPDYTRYSSEQLTDILAHVNREKFPDRYTMVLEELNRRQREPKPQIVPLLPEPELVPGAPPPTLQLLLLNAAEYGSLILLGIVWPIYEYKTNPVPTDMPIGLMFVPFTVLLFIAAGIGYGCMQYSLRFVPRRQFALRQSLLALFWAPPGLFLGGFLGALVSFAVFIPGLLLVAAVLGFIAPFWILTRQTKKNSTPH